MTDDTSSSTPLPLSMRFKQLPVPTIDGKPVLPKLKIILPRHVKDAEDKRGWGKGKALKDALSDAFDAAWKVALKSFAQTFLEIFKRRSRSTSTGIPTTSS